MPLFIFSIAGNERALSRQLSALENEQLPFAARKTANRLAVQGIADLKAKEPEVFDRPTPYAQNAWRYKQATGRSDPTAQILAKDFGGKGTPAWKFLDPEVFGGERRMKRFELALAGKFGTGFAVPGRGTTLDRYGNMSRGDVVKMLSALGAFGEQGYMANRTAHSKARSGRRQQTYFLAHSKEDGTPLGIYRVVSAGKVEPVLIFTHRAPNYSKRFPYAATAEQTVERNATTFLSEELGKALATARPKP